MLLRCTLLLHSQSQPVRISLTSVKLQCKAVSHCQQQSTAVLHALVAHHKANGWRWIRNSQTFSYQSLPCLPWPFRNLISSTLQQWQVALQSNQCMCRPGPCLLCIYCSSQQQATHNQHWSSHCLAKHTDTRQLTLEERSIRFHVCLLLTFQASLQSLHSNESFTLLCNALKRACVGIAHCVIHWVPMYMSELLCTSLMCTWRSQRHVLQMLTLNLH